ncbi:MAG: hypothetical protein IPM54_36920 [Polyangiaceae bacterium]|nr:hypothetical protein [Polyangiaceae bacterium]
MDAHEDDFAAARTPSILKISGGIGLLAGAIIMLTGIQTLSGFILTRRAFIGSIVLLIVGAGLAFAATTLMRARASGAILQTTFAGVALLASALWLLLSVAGGLVSLFGLASPLLSAAALGLAIASLGPCDKVNVARKRLAEKGLELGV